MKLFYRKYGAGPPLIILHGLYGSSDNWTTIARKLGELFTVYLPDQRNHGQSPHSAIHNYDSMRDDLYELVLDLKLKKFFLAGHSMGGKTATAFAMKWPEMINGLLVADISPFRNYSENHSAHNQHFTILQAMLSTDMSKISSRREAESVLTEKITSEKIRGFILKNLYRDPDNNFGWRINVISLLDNLGEIMESIKQAELFSQQITGFPVIFLKGSDSDYLNEEDYLNIRKVFPASEFIRIDKAGHWIHSDSPEEVIRAFNKLLSDS